MCIKCEAFADGMLKSATRAGAQVGSRAPESIIPKSNFLLTSLPHPMRFTHASARTQEETVISKGFDPAYSKEICYSGDNGDNHVQWFDRLIFAAVGGAPVSKIAQVQGFGPYFYDFIAPKGTLVRSTNGALKGEVGFPEPIPYDWITSMRYIPFEEASRARHKPERV